MAVIRIRTTVPPNRRLVIDLPPDTPEGEVEVEVHTDVVANRRPGDKAMNENKKAAAGFEANGARMLQVLEKIRQRQASDPDFRPRSKEEIDRQVEEERSSWE